MRQIHDVSEVHHILLNIAKEFDRGCKAYNIPYYMLGGTMLGAVRHKGFIPWDDDMDFGVPSPYYDKLVAALKIFIESVNVELLKGGSRNVILNVSPGSIKGTRFYAGENDLDALQGLTREIIQHLEAKDDLFIPKYEEVFKDVLKRYHDDFRKEGEHSYDYKMNSNR